MKGEYPALYQKHYCPKGGKYISAGIRFELKSGYLKICNLWRNSMIYEIA